MILGNYVMMPLGKSERTWLLYDADRWQQIGSVRKDADGGWVLSWERRAQTGLVFSFSHPSPSLAGLLALHGIWGSVMVLPPPEPMTYYDEIAPFTNDHFDYLLKEPKKKSRPRE